MALETFYHDSQHCPKLRFLYKNDSCAREFLMVKPPISVDTEHHGFYQVPVALPQRHVNQISPDTVTCPQLAAQGRQSCVHDEFCGLHRRGRLQLW